ncbi:class II aldolase/adducin family protein [Candidatus Albibeggiatoa sp. nov. BB20]|uniref:class II aldolase/adducin family protein n=1 Tax=Candidatus Albibeggiatoa sp. nov. BB20 TaxID=3162723 RepID=UPI0033654220
MHDQVLFTSGQSKVELAPDDLKAVNISETAMDTHKMSSAASLLHAMLYERNAYVGAVLHTHFVNAAVLSKFYES